MGVEVETAKRYVNMKCIRCPPFLPTMSCRYSVHLFVLVLMCYGIMVTASISNIHRYDPGDEQCKVSFFMIFEICFQDEGMPSPLATCGIS